MKISSNDYIRGGTQKDYYSEDEVIQCDCPLCESNNYKLITKERGNLGVVQCNNCDLIYVNPRLKEPEKIYWGDGNKYFEEAKLIFEGKKGSHRDNNYIHDLKIIKKFKPIGRFLDIGTNMGFFLRKAQNFNWELFGVEPSPILSEMARKYFNLNVKTSFLENSEFESDYFDIITMIDIFEHITNPNEFLKEVYRILKNDGILFIKVPNGNYNKLKFKISTLLKKRENYDLFDSYEHVIHYTKKTITKMLSKNNFNIKKILISPPVQVPVWHHYVGHYYLYPSPICLDLKHFILRKLFYWIGILEYYLSLKQLLNFGSSISVIAYKKL